MTTLTITGNTVNDPGVFVSVGIVNHNPLVATVAGKTVIDPGVFTSGGIVTNIPLIVRVPGINPSSVIAGAPLSIFKWS